MKQTILLSIFLSLFSLPYLNAQCPDIETEIIQECSMDTSELSLSFDISGGERPFVVTWQHEGITYERTLPFHNSSLTVPAGIDYHFGIEDRDGCMDTVFHEIQPVYPLFNVDFVTINPASSCTNGSVELFASGGSPPYRIREVNGQEEIVFTDTVLIDNLTPGYYFFDILDSHGCANTIFVVIDEEISDIISDITVNEASCGLCNGSVEIFTSGENAPYSIQHNGTILSFNDTVVVNNLCAGIYAFEVVDSLGCTQTTLSIIGNDDGPYLSNLIIQDNNCINEQNGSITVDVIGVPPMIYSWTGPNGFSATTINSSITNLSSGQYFLQLTDGNGCGDIMEFEIESLSEEVFLELFWTNATCTTTGALDSVVVEGENGPYELSLLGENGTAYSSENLPAGAYYACVTDINGCTNKCDTIIIQSSINVDLSSTFVNCDDTGGSVLVSVLGGANTSSFVWSNGQVGDTLSEVAAGWYSVTVTDDSTGCMTHQNVEVELNPACYVNISGYVYLDSEIADCVEDTTTLPAEYVLVELSNGEMDFTDENGFYEFQVEAGTYEVAVNLANSFYDGLCIDPINVDVPNLGNNSDDNNFWIEFTSVENLAVQLYAGPVRPGFDQTVIAYVFNLGDAPADGTLSFTHDSLQSFFTSIPSGYDYDEASTTVSWDFADLEPGTYERFVVELNLPADVVLGTLINYTLMTNPIDSDFYPENNIEKRQLTVVGSYDPNDKQVSPKGEGEEGIISRKDSIMTYQVRFQNTGTDTAFTVVVLDEIDESLDIASVRPGPSSHPYKLNVLDGNVLEFRFENIMLPDSFVNEPASNGYVLFDIKIKKDLPWGTKIENTAAIYFDFNEPIITNTTINTLAQPTNVKAVITQDLPLEISPNPGSELSILKFSLEQSTQVDLGLYDTRGHLITQYLKSEDLQSGTHQVRFEETNLPQGIYFIMLKTADGMMGMEKWVKIE